MASEIDICNLALGRLGAERITNLDNAQTPNEQLCQLFYPVARDMMLESRDWSFLMKRTALTTPNPVPPEWGYGQSFSLPSDVYRVIDCRRDTFDGQPSSFEWRKELNEILCDTDIVYIRYISRDVAAASYSTLFVMAVSTMLASLMAIQITENRGLKQDLSIEAQQWLSEAAALDGMQGKHEQINANQLVNARFNGGGSR